MSTPRIISLFSGYGGLEMGVQSVIGGDVVAHVEFDPAPSRILAHHWPAVPNLGDVTAVDWSALPHGGDVVMTGGFPCQDVSLAGLRRGLKDGTRSGLWSEFARGIDEVRPGLVVIENVRGLLSAAADREVEKSDGWDPETDRYVGPNPWDLGDSKRGPVLRALGAVLGDLADLGYDAWWCGVRAADAGAPHGRYRVFIVAHPAGEPWSVGYGDDVRARGGADGRLKDAGRGAPEDADLAARGERGIAAPGQAARGRARADAGGRGGALAADADRWQRDGWERSARGRAVERAALAWGSDVSAADAAHDHGDGSAGARGEGGRSLEAWGTYGPAVERWERVTGRHAPAPTEPTGRDGGHRLSPAFVEWMMGLPTGHVTGAGLTRNEQLKALGNGVVPQQAALAVSALLDRAAA